MPKNKIPYEIQIHNRLLKKIAGSCSISQAAGYIYSATRSKPNLRNIIFDNAANINPLITEKALLLEKKANTIKSEKKIVDDLSKQLLSKKSRDEDDLHNKKKYIDGWRESHNLKKSYKRKKQPLKAVG